MYSMAAYHRPNEMLFLGSSPRANRRKGDRRPHRVVHKVCQKELSGQRDHPEDVGVGPSGVPDPAN